MWHNPLAKYKNKHNVIKVLKEAVNNGSSTETETKHIENIKDMLGTDKIFQQLIRICDEIFKINCFSFNYSCCSDNKRRKLYC